MKALRSKLARLVAERALQAGSDADLAQEVAAFLIAEGRTNELNSIMRDVQADWAETGYVEVLAASAHPLSTVSRADIETQVRMIYRNAKQIVVTEVHDPEIVGGVRLNLANQQLDLSVEAKLNKFKQLTV